MIIKEEDCVSFAVAKLLKDKGYNEKCWGLYTTFFDDEDNPKVMFSRWAITPHNNSFEDEFFRLLCSNTSKSNGVVKEKESEKEIVEGDVKFLTLPT